MLKEYNVNNKRQQFPDNEIFLNISLPTFPETRDFLLNKSMLRKNTIVIKFEHYPYINDIFNNDKVKQEFESFVFDLIEHGKSNRFIYFSFKIKEQTMDAVVHSGLLEWIEFWMLFFKFTHINLLFEMDDENLSVSMPIAYQITKRIGNPRLSLFINSNEWNQKKQNLPEDINAFVIMVKNESMISTEDLRYATMFVNK